jgi:hypothetical protein
MALLGLVGLLHRVCARSSPFDLGSTSTPESTQTRLAPVSASARRRPADDMTGRSGVSNQPEDGIAGISCERKRGSDGLGQRPFLRTTYRCNTPGEYCRIALRRPNSRCYPLATLGAGTLAGKPSEPQTWGRERPSQRCRERYPRPSRPSFPVIDPWPPLPVKSVTASRIT